MKLKLERYKGKLYIYVDGNHMFAWQASRLLTGTDHEVWSGIFTDRGVNERFEYKGEKLDLELETMDTLEDSMEELKRKIGNRILAVRRWVAEVEEKKLRERLGEKIELDVEELMKRI